MPVEIDVINANAKLAPGMFPEVLWPTKRPHPSLFVPVTAVASISERTFVIRINNGTTEWIDVKHGAALNYQGIDLIEVFGDLAQAIKLLFVVPMNCAPERMSL